MIAFNNERNENTWQSDFVAMLPEIEQKLRLAFCRLDPEAREDAIERASCIRCWPMCDWMNKAEPMLQPRRAWLGIARGTLSVVVRLVVE